MSREYLKHGTLDFAPHFEQKVSKTWKFGSAPYFDGKVCFQLLPSILFSVHLTVLHFFFSFNERQSSPDEIFIKFLFSPRIGLSALILEYIQLFLSTSSLSKQPQEVKNKFLTKLKNHSKEHLLPAAFFLHCKFVCL